MSVSEELFQICSLICSKICGMLLRENFEIQRFPFSPSLGRRRVG